MTTGLLDLPAAEFVAAFDERSMRFRHHLTDHPLLTSDRLVTLAEELPAAYAEHNRGALDTVLPSGDAARIDASPGEVARTIDTNGCWMVLRRVEQSAPYRALLDALLDEVSPLLADPDDRMQDRAGFIFLSSAAAVTPVHTDPEHNLLLQVRGTKEISIGRWPDVSTEQRELERSYRGGHRNLPAVPPQRDVVTLQPGDGVYVPLFAPHWVINGPQLSISLSITWRTPRIVREQRVHSFNNHLRRLHLSPRPPGRSAFVDRGKAALMASWEATPVRKRQAPTPGP